METVQHWGETLRLLVEVAATAAFALSGVMAAARKQLDAVGVCTVAFLSAFGGGTVRDLLLDQRPFFWVRHVELLWGVLRDIVCNEIPTVLRDHRPYAICAFAGGWVYLGIWQTQAPGWVALLACLVVTAGLRALAIWRNWALPAWRT